MIVTRAASTTLPTGYGLFTVIAYTASTPRHPGAPPQQWTGQRGGLQREHLALIKGDVEGTSPTLVRVHSECMTGDLFGCLRCDCGQQLHEALRLIEGRGRGVLLYMRQEGRGIGLINKLRAYTLQDRGYDTVEANAALGFCEDERDYAMSAAILLDLGASEVELLTNNPRKVAGLEKNGVSVFRRLPILTEPNEANRRYLETKREKLGHLLGHP